MKTIRLLGIMTATAIFATGCDLKSIAEDILKKADGGTSDSGPTGDCNALVNGGSVITKMTNAGPPPTMTGGTIADGTYYLTRMDKWNGVSGSSTHKETWQFAGNTVQVVDNNESDNGVTRRFSGTYSTSGNMVTLNVTCPVTMSVTSPYTVTGNDLTTINADDPNESHTYTKQ